MLLKSILIALIFGLGFSVKTENVYPPIIDYGKILNSPIENIIALSIGIRDLYSDILYIRLLQYYGTREEGVIEYGSGKYPYFYNKAIEIAVINPYYKNVILNSSGVLAFNLDKTYKAISLLRFAMIYDNNYNYNMLLAAILIKESRKNNIDDLLLKKLYSIAIEKDCPIILRQIIAFLHKNAGKYRQSYEIYNLIISTSKEKRYIENAKRQIEELKEYI